MASFGESLRKAIRMLGSIPVGIYFIMFRILVVEGGFRCTCQEALHRAAVSKGTSISIPYQIFKDIRGLVIVE